MLVGEESAVRFQIGISYQVVGVQLLSKSDLMGGFELDVMASCWQFCLRFQFGR